MDYKQIQIILKNSAKKLDRLRCSEDYQCLEKSDAYRQTNLSLIELIDGLYEIEEMVADVPYVPIYEEIASLNLKQLGGLLVLVIIKLHRETMASFLELYEEFGYYDIAETLVTGIDHLFTTSDYQKLFASIAQKLSTSEDIQP
jgi:hypothetical protein